jgi:putative PIN family toxin of toxin-antitoxin system
LKKIKAVFDTNVLVSAWFWRGAESRLVELAEEGVIEAHTSPQLLTELRRALEYPKFRLEQSEIDEICDYYILVLRTVEPKRSVNVIPEDPEDNRVIECADESVADFIISGNHHLLDLRRYGNMRIVRAKEMLEELTQK